MIFADDQSRYRKGNGAKNTAIVRHFAVDLVRTARKPQRPKPLKPQRKATKPRRTSIKLRKKKIAGWDDNYPAKQIGATPS